MNASDNNFFIDLVSEFQRKLIAQMENEFATLCSCTAAGVPVGDMCVVKIETSTPREPMQYKVGLFMMSANELIKSGTLNGYRSEVYLMQ